MGQREEAGQLTRSAYSATEDNVSRVSPDRLPFLDGLRGFAALYVLLHHAALAVPPAGLHGQPLLTVRFLLRHGHAVVGIFIVLSGYCLARPLVLNPESRTRLNLRSFLWRRACRIYPPYLAALCLSLVLIQAVPGLAKPQRVPWDRALPSVGNGIVTSHVLLFHNLSNHWIYKIDPPMWSIATEWQIYLCFPALVVVWNRMGMRTCVASAFFVGFGMAALAGPLTNSAIQELCPWFLGLFALGMASAFGSSLHALASRQRGATLLDISLGVLSVGCLWLAMGSATRQGRQFLLIDPLVGLGTALLLTRWARRARSDSQRPIPPLLPLLGSRFAVWLGSISYSLYLVHYPLLALADSRLRELGLHDIDRFWTLLLVVSPLVLGGAALFHLVFERPFLHTRSGLDQNASVARSPAPHVWYRRFSSPRLAPGSRDTVRSDHPPADGRK